jgi:CheY-like chemotaxis protein
MNQHIDSSTLFAKQIQGHIQSLCDLLGCDTMAPAPSNLIERCAVGTRMLAGTCSLMGLPAWERTLHAYEEFLVRYNETGMRWDERVAQVTSELVEKEEALATAYEEHHEDAQNVVHADVLAALCEEMGILQESIAAAGAREAASGESHTTDPALVSPGGAIPMNGVVTELKNVYDGLIAGLETGAFASREWASNEIANIRNQLCFLDFYICSIEQMIERRSPSAVTQKCSLLPLKTVLNDFANDVSGAGERALDIVLTSDKTRIDPRLLPTAGAILQRLITDVFDRSECDALGISIGVTEIRGALRWLLKDNGNNFISDSQLDHEDQLAFYPGLKDVRRMLGRYHGVLWVEPRDGREVRFEFTLPQTRSPDSFLIWGEGVRTFGIRSVQLCDLVAADVAPKGLDSYGEFLTLDNKRVPLLKLDVLFRDAPSDGRCVAVIGSLEKRVAFYVPDEGTLVEGRALEGVVPVWQGPAHLVAQVDGRRVALLDADQILEEYLDRTGELNSEGVSGGVAEDESDKSSSQTAFDSNVITPPDLSSRARGSEDVDVLVVEQSETLRGVLTDILSDQGIRATFVGEAEKAIELIHERAPHVIISEFRMPTMAAKVLVETLNSEGKSIPVLVTTSQSGKTADLLVEKLGVAGYLSKPLNRDEVAKRIDGFLAERANA